MDGVINHDILKTDKNPKQGQGAGAEPVDTCHEMHPNSVFKRHESIAELYEHLLLMDVLEAI